MIKDAGGIEVCYGGIGIHGHVAFNEPGPGVAESNPRILDINEFTRTIDATRHPGVGGNLENFPRRAITMGMKQCIEAFGAGVFLPLRFQSARWRQQYTRNHAPAGRRPKAEKHRPI